MATTAGIRDAAWFGSTATGRTDEWSDIDLVVQGDSAAGDRFVRRLHDLLGVVLYRPFSLDRPPAGRYWFREGSPFRRLDVSFYGSEDYRILLVDGMGPKQPPFEPVSFGRGRTPVEPSSMELEFSELECAFAGALRRFHESVKAVARGGRPKRPVEAARVEVAEFEGRGVRPEAWALYGRTLSLLPPGLAPA